MTTAPISESNIKERDFMSMLPLEYLKKATDESLRNGLLIELQFREKYSFLSAVGLKFDNGSEIIESPLFGDKRKIDRT